MIVSIWVYFLLGDTLAGEQGTPYVQHTASEIVHSRPEQRDRVEAQTRAEFNRNYPGHSVCEGGWCKQKVEVRNA
jgi:hypothetical protein